MENPDLQRLIELLFYDGALEVVAVDIWKVIRRDVFSAVALNGLLANTDVKVEISDQSIHNTDVYTTMAIAAADSLIAKLDEPARPETGIEEGVAVPEKKDAADQKNPKTDG